MDILDSPLKAHEYIERMLIATEVLTPHKRSPLFFRGLIRSSILLRLRSKLIKGKRGGSPQAGKPICCSVCTERIRKWPLGVGGNYLPRARWSPTGLHIGHWFTPGTDHREAQRSGYPLSGGPQAYPPSRYKVSIFVYPRECH